jgi:hypothetical protein
MRAVSLCFVSQLHLVSRNLIENSFTCWCCLLFVSQVWTWFHQFTRSVRRNSGFLYLYPSVSCRELFSQRNSSLAFRAFRLTPGLPSTKCLCLAATLATACRWVCLLGAVSLLIGLSVAPTSYWSLLQELLVAGQEVSALILLPIGQIDAVSTQADCFSSFVTP